MKKDPLVYIITLNWNSIQSTVEFLESISCINYSNYKIIVVNNDTEDFPEDIRKRFPGHIIINNYQNMGFAKGNNQGIQRAIEENADYILLVNNDTVVEKNFLNGLMNHSAEHPSTIVSPKILYYDTRKIDNIGIRLIPWLGVYQLIKKEQKRFLDSLSGACFMAKKESFEDIGLLDENFFCFAEDLDWSCRARRKGYSLKVVKNREKKLQANLNYTSY